MTEPLDTIRPEPKRDRFGRYMLPDPRTGNNRLRAWTRATTVAGACDDTYALTAWGNRMVAAGMARRPDLVGLAASVGIEDRDRLTKVANDAKEAAHASSKANSGTALHQLTERLDRGEKVDPPPPWDADLRAYRMKLADEGIQVEPDLIERIVLIPELGVAGTADRLVHVPGVEDLVVADIKTGQVKYSWMKFSAQLAIYAHASWIWDGEQWHPMPDVDRSRGLIIHLPVGQATCELYWLDLNQGWAVAEMCDQVRWMRTHARDLSTPYFSYSTSSPSTNGGEGDDPMGQIQAAADVDALYEVWSRADSEGRWTDDLTQAAAQRKHELTNNKSHNK